MAFLQVEDLSFRYPDAERSALENISFTVGVGDFVAVCGVSGCGKSTLLSLLKRGIAPFGKMSGSIFINGINFKNFRVLLQILNFSCRNFIH